MNEIRPHLINTVGPCMDVKAHNGLLYTIQKISQFPGGRLCVLSRELCPIAEFVGIGNARQIEMIGDVAVVSAREDGLWLFDVSHPDPRLLCHYPTVEYATGVALCGNLAFISCRQYGVQILDISAPTHPIHISLVRIGEIQSATVSNGILYGGAWGEMKVVAVDVRDPAAPKMLTEIPLQGRGDGLCVKDGILYAATGQHARGIKNVVDVQDPCFGIGDGVEAFDVRDPAHPIRLGGIKFNKAYCISIDMWEAAFYGDTLVVNNPPLGVYGLEPDTLHVKWHFPLPPSDGVNGVTGVTVLNGDLIVATESGGLYAYRGTKLATQTPNDTQYSFQATPQPFAYACECGAAALHQRYSGSFPVLSITETPEHLTLACGEGGVHLLDKHTLSPVAIIPTKGMAQDVKYRNGRLYIAEEASGIEIYSLTKGSPVRLGGYHMPKSVYQIQPSNSGRYLMCTGATQELNVLDVSDPNSVKLCYSHRVRSLLYGNNFASVAADGKMLLFCHRDGLIFTDPDKRDFAFHVIKYTKSTGFCSFCAGEGIETDRDRIFYTHNGGLALLSTDHADTTDINTLPLLRAEEHFKGLLTIKNGRILATNRCKGSITLLEEKSSAQLHICARLQCNASPGKAIFTEDRILIPGGRSGLLELTE